MNIPALSGPVRLLLVVGFSLGVIVMLRPSSSAERLMSRWQPAQLVAQPDQPAHHPNAPPPVPIEGQAFPVEQFDIVVDDGLYSDQREPLAADLQRALGYVSGRFGSGPASRFRAVLVLDDGCGLHGIAYTDIRITQVHACSAIGRSRAVAIMAHEFVHQLQQDRYGPAHLSADLILSEGMATWAAGDYWLNGQPDFRSYVRAQRRAGLFYPLATHYNGLGIAAMNALYYEWASFVDFLITTYGRERFDQLYVSGRSAPGSADYQSVYGKGLDALEYEWKAWLEQ